MPMARSTVLQAAVVSHRLEKCVGDNRGANARSIFRSENRNVFCLRLASLSILADFESDLIAFAQRSTALKGRDMDEHILPAIVRGDEVEAFVVGEKFYCACGQVNLILDVSRGSAWGN